MNLLLINVLIVIISTSAIVTDAAVRFHTTLWTFTRIYPSVGFSHDWRLLSQVELRRRPSSLVVILGLESFWPMVYVFVCYPFAGVFGSIKIVLFVGMFLIMNNLCYISLGTVPPSTTDWLEQGFRSSGHDSFYNILPDLNSRGGILHQTPESN
jgi:hypothetical protein